MPTYVSGESTRDGVQIYVRNYRGQLLLYYIIISGSYKILSMFLLKNLRHQVVVSGSLINRLYYATRVP